MRKVISVLIILFAIATLCLGIWQIQRGFLKKKMHEEFLSRQAQPIVELTTEALYNDEFENRRVAVRAKHLTMKRVYVDNNSQNGEPGYYVVEFAELEDYTPFAIVRGFIPLGEDRRFVPSLKDSPNPFNIEGLIRGYSNRVMSMGSTTTEPLGNDIYRIQYLERAPLEEIVKAALADKVVFTLEPKETSLGYDWPMPTATGAHRSFSYAIQWFLMSFAAISFLLVMHFRRGRAE